MFLDDYALNDIERSVSQTFGKGIAEELCYKILLFEDSKRQKMTFHVIMTFEAGRA